MRRIFSHLDRMFRFTLAGFVAIVFLENDDLHAQNPTSISLPLARIVYTPSAKSNSVVLVYEKDFGKSGLSAGSYYVYQSDGKTDLFDFNGAKSLTAEASDQANHALNSADLGLTDNNGRPPLTLTSPALKKLTITVPAKSLSFTTSAQINIEDPLAALPQLNITVKNSANTTVFGNGDEPLFQLVNSQKKIVSSGRFPSLKASDQQTFALPLQLPAVSVADPKSVNMELSGVIYKTETDETFLVYESHKSLDSPGTYKIRQGDGKTDLLDSGRLTSDALAKINVETVGLDGKSTQPLTRDTNKKLQVELPTPITSLKMTIPAVSLTVKLIATINSCNPPKKLQVGVTNLSSENLPKNLTVSVTVVDKIVFKSGSLLASVPNEKPTLLPDLFPIDVCEGFPVIDLASLLDSNGDLKTTNYSQLTRFVKLTNPAITNPENNAFTLPKGTVIVVQDATKEVLNPTLSSTKLTAPLEPARKDDREDPRANCDVTPIESLAHVAYVPAGFETRLELRHISHKPLKPWLPLSFVAGKLVYLPAERWGLEVRCKCNKINGFEFVDSRRPKFVTFLGESDVQCGDKKPTRDCEWHGYQVRSVLLIPVSVDNENTLDQLADAIELLEVPNSGQRGTFSTGCATPGRESLGSLCQFFNLGPSPMWQRSNDGCERLSETRAMLLEAVGQAKTYATYKKDLEALYDKKRGLERRWKQLASSHSLCSTPVLNGLEGDLGEINQKLPYAERDLQQAGNSLIRAVLTSPKQPVVLPAVDPQPMELKVDDLYKQ